jgi:hypothetical protein
MGKGGGGVLHVGALMCSRGGCTFPTGFMQPLAINTFSMRVTVASLDSHTHVCVRHR